MIIKLATQPEIVGENRLSGKNKHATEITTSLYLKRVA